MLRFTSVQNIIDFVARLGRRATKEARAKPQLIDENYHFAGTSSELFEGEIKRIQPFWVQGRRQFLTLGLTAYALKTLGLEPKQIVNRLERFLNEVADEEKSRRMEAVWHTISKASQGQTIALIQFYEKAQVEPPYSVVSESVLKKLELAKQHFAALEKTGLAWQTNTAVFSMLLELGKCFGKEHHQGVSVSISHRDLSERCGFSRQTIEKSLKRMAKIGLVYQSGQTSKSTGLPGQIMIKVDGRVQTLSHSPENNVFPLGGLSEWTKLYTHPAFDFGKLNKSSFFVIQALAILRKPASRSEIAKQLGKSSRSIRKPLEKLLNYELIIQAKNRYELIEEWQECLEQIAALSGANKRRDVRKQRHYEERIAFMQKSCIK